MFEDEARVIRAARRWAWLCKTPGVSDDVRGRILRELQEATLAFEKGRHLKPLRGNG